MTLLVGLLAAVAAGLAVPPARRRPVVAEASRSGGAVGTVYGVQGDDRRRFSWLWATLTGVACWVFVSGPVGAIAGAVAGVVAWVVLERAETPAERRERARTRADLPHLVGLLAAAVRGGLPPGPALGVVCSALPGPAADLLARLPPRIALGVDPVDVWRTLDDHDALAPLGRTLARSEQTGEPVATALDRLATELAARERGDTEDRARRVGVRAALPLGLCLLPAFLLLGIVPLVAGLVDALAW